MVRSALAVCVAAVLASGCATFPSGSGDNSPHLQPSVAQVDWLHPIDDDWVDEYPILGFTANLAVTTVAGVGVLGLLILQGMAQNGSGFGR